MEEFVSSLEPGEVVAERYEVRSLIARFGVNDVHEAHDRHLDRLVDLFSVRVPKSAAPNIELSLRRDLALSQRVSHPNVWRFYSYEPDLDGGVIEVRNLSTFPTNGIHWSACSDDRYVRADGLLEFTSAGIRALPRATPESRPTSR